MIEEIKQIFNDIRDAIIEMGGDIDVCTSPEQYAEAIKALTGNTAVLCIPVFKSSELKPARPVGTMSPADPTDYPEGGGTPDGLTGNVGMSYTMVSASTVYVPWTEPVLMAQAVNPQPVNYDDATTRTFIICLELPTLSVTPTVPVGGTGNTGTNTLIDVPVFVYNDTTFYWSTDNDHIPGCYTGMSFGTFLAEDGSQIGTGSDPICINSVRDGKDGKDGRNGVDGTDIEFIYKLCHNEAEAQLVETPYSDPDINDYIPSPRYDQIGKGGGSDSPEGIDSDTWRVEIMCTRKKNVETGKGEAFVGPAIWSSGGEDGMDGDGVEYIFRVATNAEVTQDANGKYHLNNIGTWPPTCEETCANGFLTVARTSAGYISDADALEAYQQDEFIPGDAEICPDAARLGGDRNGTDDPLDVDVNEPFEFVSIRKYDGATEKGGGFSEPVLWNKYYVTSAPIFTSFAFCRSTKNLAGMTLTGGTVINPLPSDQTVDGELIHGYDSVPGAAEYAAAHDPNPNRCNAPIWMTSSKFGSADPSVVVSPNGASPKLMSDNRYFNSEYSCSSIDPSAVSFHLPRFDETPAGSSTTQPFLDPTSPEGVNESSWRTWCTNHGLGTGSDDESYPKWMATCTFENGLGSDGTVTQIKGEDGTDGQDGQDGEDGRGIVSIVYSYMWSNDGTNHPSASDPGWSSSIPANPNNYTYLWRKTVTTYSSGTTTETTYEIISKTGQRGPIGPKMRMRNGNESYTAPDGEGMSGGLSGDGASDAFYDIAIYPPAAEGINVTNAASNADRLYRCTQSITYAEIADLVTTYGVGNVHPGSGGHLDSYFTQAVGWDFVATKLLLADRINANQIDVHGLSTDTLVTTPENEDPDSYIRAQGNNMILYKTGTPACIITADPLKTDASDTVTKVWENPLGYNFLYTTTDPGIHFSTSLGQFRISEPEQGQSSDYLYSVNPQFVGVRIEGTVNTNVTFFANEMAFASHLFINAININTGQIAGTGRQNGYVESLPYLTSGQQSFSQGDTLHTGATFELDTTQHFSLSPGLYRLELTGDMGTGWDPSKIDNYRLTVYQTKGSTIPPQSQIAYDGTYHSPVVVHHTHTVNPQTTEIASDGFAHVLDNGNYFRLRHPVESVGGVDTPDPNTLLMEFRVTDPNNASNAFGLQISKAGIKKGDPTAGSGGTGDGVAASL